MKDIKIFNESRTGFTEEFLSYVKLQKSRLSAYISIYKRFRLNNNHDFNFALKFQIKLEHARRACIKHTFKQGQIYLNYYRKALLEVKNTYEPDFQYVEKNFNYSYKRIKLSVVGLR